jgi:hypothetical protein
MNESIASSSPAHASEAVRREENFLSARMDRLAPLGVFIAALTLGAGVFAFCFRRGWTNLYGDGQAHVAIARKVVDAASEATPWDCYVQLGSPWLPLQHALMLPLVWNDDWWRTGVAGSVVSVASFAVGATFLFQLARRHYGGDEPASGGFAWFAPYLTLFWYALNPSLLYLQTTPLTEPLFLATLAGAAYFLRKWADDQRPRTLLWAALWTLAATLTRYEAWATIPFVAPLIIWLSHRRRWRKCFDAAAWLAVVAVGPLYWLWHNHAIYGRALEFYSGVYSAQGYFLRNRDALSLTNFVVGRPLYAGLLSLITVAICSGPATLLAGAGGAAAALIGRRKKDCAAAALFIPPLFTTYSLFSGNIQIYPFFLNVRYGLSALLGLAAFAPQAALLFRPKARLIVAAGMLAACLGQSAYLLKEGFLQLSVFQEGYRVQFFQSVREQKVLAAYLAAHPGSGDVVMHTGELARVVADGGLRYANVIHEGARRWSDLTREIPPSVETLVYREGDPLDAILKTHPAGLDQFAPAWRVGAPALVVLRRRP